MRVVVATERTQRLAGKNVMAAEGVVMAVVIAAAAAAAAAAMAAATVAMAAAAAAMAAVAAVAARWAMATAATTTTTVMTAVAEGGLGNSSLSHEYRWLCGSHVLARTGRAAPFVYQRDDGIPILRFPSTAEA